MAPPGLIAGAADNNGQKMSRKESMATTLRSQLVRLNGNEQIVGTGWVPPVIDRRDFTETHPEIAPLTQKLNVPFGTTKGFGAPLPPSVDLRAWCSPIENQGQL